MSSSPPTKKPPYLLGLLGFIPLVGFFVGLGLTLYGILYYRDKIFTFIGIGCMVFTVLVYSFLFLTFSGLDMGSEYQSKRGLKDLIKEIEFYKIENGSYPDSLQQLKQTNEHILIIDLIQLEEDRKNIYYHYKNLGDHYILFSVGLDGIPNTKDDLYPRIKPGSKVGWMKK